MSDTQLSVVAKVKAKEGKEAELKEMLLGMVAPTRMEPDCMEYLLHQSSEDERVFVFYEQWTSKKALDKHMKTPHFLAFAAKTEELLDGPPEISLLQVLM